MSRVVQQWQGFDTVEAQLWVVVVVSLVLDVALTYTGLQHGFVEGNPVLARGMETFGFAALGVAKVAAVSLAGLYRTIRPEYATAIPPGLALPWVVAVLVNTIHLAPVMLS